MSILKNIFFKNEPDEYEQDSEMQELVQMLKDADGNDDEFPTTSKNPFLELAGPMDKYFVLETDKVSKNPYDETYRSRKVSSDGYSQFMNNLLTDEANYGTIQCFVKRDKPIHVLVLDCDSRENLIAGQHWIKSVWNLGSATIESSSGHYWIFTDYITDDISNIIFRMLEVPGADPKHILKSKERGAIQIRMTPKKIGNDYVSPVFAEDHDLTNENAITLYNMVKKWFDSKDYQMLIKSKQLRAALKDNKILDMATDPDFEV